MENDTKKQAVRNRILLENAQEKEWRQQLMFCKAGGALQELDLLSTGVQTIWPEALDIRKNEISTISKYLGNKTATLLMVGFGYFPITLMMLRFHFPSLQLLGVDADEDVVLSTKVFFDRYENTQNIVITCSQAETFDYSGVDIIFLANVLLNKNLIRDQIHNTSRTGIMVFARNPLASGLDTFEVLEEGICFKKKEEITTKYHVFTVFQNV